MKKVFVFIVLALFLTSFVVANGITSRATEDDEDVQRVVDLVPCEELVPQEEDLRRDAPARAFPIIRFSGISSRKRDG